jgi:hypothetical protein
MLSTAWRRRRFWARWRATARAWLRAAGVEPPADGPEPLSALPEVEPPPPPAAGEDPDPEPPPPPEVEDPLLPLSPPLVERPELGRLGVLTDGTLTDGAEGTDGALTEGTDGTDTWGTDPESCDGSVWSCGTVGVLTPPRPSAFGTANAVTAANTTDAMRKRRSFFGIPAITPCPRSIPRKDTVVIAQTRQWTREKRPDSSAESARITCMTALISARWVNA